LPKSFLETDKYPLTYHSVGKAMTEKLEEIVLELVKENKALKEKIKDLEARLASSGQSASTLRTPKVVEDRVLSPELRKKMGAVALFKVLKSGAWPADKTLREWCGDSGIPAE